MPAKKSDRKRAALWYASFNWHVFPVAADTKTPLTPNGYKDASADAAQIEAWWARWPDANIGLACGMSGVVALDADPQHYAEGSEEFVANLHANHRTASQSTPTRGQHFIYMLPAGVELNNSPGKLPAGVDVRVNGYVLLAPSRVVYRAADARTKGIEDGYSGSYKWLDWPHELPPQPLPDHVLELLKKPERQAPPPSPNTNGYGTRRAVAHHANGNGSGDGARYAQRALESEIAILRSAPNGNRNNQLNISAMKLAQLVAGGELVESEVVAALESTALEIGLEDEAGNRRTIASGFKKGKAEPRQAPEMPRLKFRRRDANAEPIEDDAQFDDELGAEVTAPNVFDYHPEDGGLLDAWIDTCSNEWVYVTGYETWYGWAGAHWQIDDTLEVPYQLAEMIRAMNEQARGAVAKARAEDNKDKAKAFGAYVSATKRSKSRIASIEGMARATRTRPAASLDKGNVLNLLNGTLDLDTLILRDHDRGDMLTYTLPYEYDYYAACPRFKQFISEVLVKSDSKTPDPDLALLAQELVGYSLTQDTGQEAMVWLAGEGGNGKTVLITILSKLLGPLAVGMNFQTIGMAGNYDLADLPGKRIVFSTESERGGNMAEGYIKRIVSGETIRARPIYGTPFSFESAAKIWWAMNDMPTVKDTSNALHRRLKLIRFHRVFKDSEKDIHLIDKLSEELPGILNWALEGLLRLRRQGQFTQAAAADNAKDEFKLESNPVALWLRERTEPGGETLATAAFQNYALWCTRSGHHELNSTNFGRELARLNVQKARKGSGNVYKFSLLEGV